MSVDISKLCSDFLRSDFAAQTGGKLKASHSRELVAAYFGFKSHAALLAEKAYPVSEIERAVVLVPNIALIEQRRACLEGLPAGLDKSRQIASKLSDHLKAEGYFTGEVWLAESLETYVMETYLIEKDGRIMDELSGVMAETNADFSLAFGEYETAEVMEYDDSVMVEVKGQYNGSIDPERPFCGDQIDMTAYVELGRVAGKTAFAEPDISAAGSVNDDWVDPELRFGSADAAPAATDHDKF